MALAAAFELSHLAVLALTLLLSASLIIAARKADSPRFTKALCWTMAVVLLANEFGYYVRGYQAKTWSDFVRSSLPLHLCGIALYATVVTLITRRQFIFEMACFWGLVGTPQAILTPTVELDFWNYWSWQFFICHCGIVVGVIFAIGALSCARGEGQPGGFSRSPTHSSRESPSSTF